MTTNTKRVAIDGHDYEITQLGALRGRKLWLKLLHVIAEPLKTLGSLETLNEQAFATVIAAALEGLDEATVEEFCDTYGASCTVRVGERWPTLTGEVFDQHFARRYVSMSKWLLECTTFNFADFLGDNSLGNLAAKFRAAAAKASPGQNPPTTSTGSSGES
jgi:hypothetical protein